jgi:hypothetical protein
MKRILFLLLATSLPATAMSRAAVAAVNVERHGSENPMQEVAKSVIYGGLTGLVIGSAIAIADDGGNDGDIIRWSFVGGTFFGLAYGIYHVHTRPQALLELEDGEPRLGSLMPTIAPDGQARVHLIGVRF